MRDFFWILNTLPYRAKGLGTWYPGRCPGLRTCWAFSPRRAADKAFPHNNLHRLNIPILNILPEGGAARTCSEGLRRSTVAHFARKVRGANIMAAKHELKIQESHAPDFATCSWPSLCEQSELQCWRRRFSLRGRGPHFASKVSYSAGAADFRSAMPYKLSTRGRR